MREWRIWDWIAYVALFLATALEALEAGLKQAPKVAGLMPSVFSADWLSFVPFTLVCAATAIFVFRAFSHNFATARTPTTRITTDHRPVATFLFNPPGGFVWLGEGAKEIYGKLGKCRVRDMVEAVGKDGNGITNVVARMIAQYADIYGQRAPSRVTAKVEHQEIDELVFFADGSTLYTSDFGRVVWDHLMIKMEDLTRATDVIMNARHSSALQIR
jgi:hypothetical protein